MDQFVVALGEDTPEPSTEDWAVAAGTIAYEIVTQIGACVPRVVIGATDGHT